MQDMDVCTIEDLRNEVALLNAALYSLAVTQNNKLSIKLHQDTMGEFHCAAKVEQVGDDLYLRFISMASGARQ